MVVQAGVDPAAGVQRGRGHGARVGHDHKVLPHLLHEEGALRYIILYVIFSLCSLGLS